MLSAKYFGKATGNRIANLCISKWDIGPPVPGTPNNFDHLITLKWLNFGVRFLWIPLVFLLIPSGRPRHSEGGRKE